MSELRYTLVSDGSSDAMLLPVLDWLLEQHSRRVFVGRWADLRSLRRPPRGLSERVHTALELFPCDLLFVHRDAERATREVRASEVGREVERVGFQSWIPVVPVRMLEAWFIFEERALRTAAGNPEGAMELDLPAARRVEGISSPKALLDDLLRKASGHTGRRLEKLRLGPMKHRVASLIRDFAPLRALPAFVALESDLQRTLALRRWA